MAKTLFDAFTEKLHQNLPNTRTMKEAFDKTNEEMGFDAYTSWNSYSVVKRRNKKGRR